MTTLTDRPLKAGDPQPEGSRFSLKTLVVVLALTVVGLGAWIVYDQAIAGVDSDIEEVLDGYYGAWNTRDQTAILDVTTDDFTYDEWVYFDDPLLGFGLTLHQSGDVDTIIKDDFEGLANVGGTFSGWTVQQVGDPIVQSEGPARLVAVNEDWISGNMNGRAQSLYTMVEVDGTLKILHHSFVNLTTYPTS